MSAYVDSDIMHDIYSLKIIVIVENNNNDHQPSG